MSIFVQLFKMILEACVYIAVFVLLVWFFLGITPESAYLTAKHTFHKRLAQITTLAGALFEENGSSQDIISKFDGKERLQKINENFSRPPHP